ncbi:gibberellin 20 oxidase 2-like [Malus domestica]|uniref:gibberellin 20 oxidase 2-like n=1 Tax=Malus domestica TaxID=3750 RepID=UPI003976544B
MEYNWIRSERLRLLLGSFFDLPSEEKRRIWRDEKTVLGYYDTEHTKNVRDWKEVFDFTVEKPMVLCDEYAREVEKLALKLLGLIALSLGLPENRFNSYFEDRTSFIRLNHYPPCPSPQLAIGVGRHKDSGALTVLSQDDVGGLEVMRKADGEWITPNAYIINVGDILQDPHPSNTNQNLKATF